MKNELEKHKLVPVVAIDNAAHAGPLAEALTNGGLPVAEITLRTDVAFEAIKALSAIDNFLVGAGTVHSCEQAKQVFDCGAKFIVTPGFNPKTVQWCLDHSVPVFPGISSPTDLEMALEHGLGIVKFFPAEVLGGVKMLKALQGPYRNMRFIPTGGINQSNLGDYLALQSVIACGGSWMVKSNLIADEQFDQISKLTRQATELASA